MNILQIADYYFQGKPIVGHIRKGLALIFYVVITNFVYTSLYGPYQWMSIDDYKSILTFIVSGRILIAISLYFFVYSILRYLSYLLFTKMKNWRAHEIEDYIEEAWKKIINGEKATTTSNWSSTIFMSLFQFLNPLYESHSVVRDQELIDNLSSSLAKENKSIKENVYTCIQGFIAVSVVWYSVPEFTWYLAILTITVLCATIFMNIVFYRLCSIVPQFLRALKKYDEVRGRTEFEEDRDLNDENFTRKLMRDV